MKLANSKNSWSDILKDDMIVEDRVSYLDNWTDEDSEMWFDNFIELNSSFFSHHEPKKTLGFGSDGTAYLLASNMVLKIFSSFGLAKFYKSELDKLHSGSATKYTLMIYDLGRLYQPDSIEFPEQTFPIFYVVMEKLDNEEKIGSDEVYRSIYSFIESNYNLDDYINLTGDQLMAASKNIWEEFRKVYKADEIGGGFYTKLNDGKEIISEPGLVNQPGSFDFEEGGDFIVNYIASILYNLREERKDLLGNLNLGYRGDTPVFFDPYSPPPNSDKDSGVLSENFQNFDKKQKLAKLKYILNKGKK
jgi:hypothetical protein